MGCYFNLEASGHGNFALGTLGGSNPFEVGKYKDENVVLVHSGSRRMVQIITQDEFI